MEIGENGENMAIAVRIVMVEKSTRDSVIILHPPEGGPVSKTPKTIASVQSCQNGSAKVCGCAISQCR